MAATGRDLLKVARKRIGEKYVLGTLVPKNNPEWHGPWDCAEFVSWVVYQVSGSLYGCERNGGDPATADAYTGYWARDAKSLVKKVSVDEAARTPGAVVLRIPAAEAMGHIVISDGEGGTVEAHSTKRGVIASTLNQRRWDTGLLVPGVEFSSRAEVDVSPPKVVVLRLIEPDHMTGPEVKDLQRALKAAGISPGRIDGDFGRNTHTAVAAFQATRGLIADGEVGSTTAKALGLVLAERDEEGEGGGDDEGGEGRDDEGGESRDDEGGEARDDEG